jgi:hypothetical protein
MNSWHTNPDYLVPSTGKISLISQDRAKRCDMEMSFSILAKIIVTNLRTKVMRIPVIMFFTNRTSEILIRPVPQAVTTELIQFCHLAYQEPPMIGSADFTHHLTHQISTISQFIILLEVL